MFEKAVTIKTSKVPKLALDQVIARLKASDQISWKGYPVTKEAVTNALWLWIDDLDPSVVEKAMSIYVPRLEAILKGDPVPAVEEEARDVLTPVTFKTGEDARKRKGTG